MLYEDDLHDYQEYIADSIVDNPKIAVFADMGLGKTAATLTAIKRLYDEFEIARVLIVGPLRVTLSTWPAEIKKWDHLKDLPFQQLAGLDVKMRSAACLQQKLVLNFINRELVDWLVHHYKAKWPYDMVILDESSSFKSSSSNRFKALVKIQHAIGIPRIVELTGTPTSVGLQDLWSQIYLLDMGRRLGYSFNAFKKRYFETDEYTKKIKIRDKSESIIHRKIKDICIRLAADDYIEMPDKLINDIWVPFPDDLVDKYKELESEMALALDTGTAVADFAASLTGKLLQFCNGALYLDEASRWEALHDLKLQALDSVIEEAAGAPVLVAYQFRFDKERILKRYKNAVPLDDDPETIDRWNRGEIDILVTHPASAGHGLNLQEGSNIIAWFGLTWSLELYQQFNARLHRQGQTKPVFIHRILMSNTVEQIVVNALEQRYKTQWELLEAVKDNFLLESA